jgi:hypothetical protein
MLGSIKTACAALRSALVATRRPTMSKTGNHYKVFNRPCHGVRSETCLPIAGG